MPILLLLMTLMSIWEDSKIKRKVILSVMGVISILAAILLFTNALNIMMDKVGYIIIRLFGYGYGCSGYIFSVLDNRINIGN